MFELYGGTVVQYMCKHKRNTVIDKALHETGFKVSKNKVSEMGKDTEPEIDPLCDKLGHLDLTETSAVDKLNSRKRL